MPQLSRKHDSLLNLDFCHLRWRLQLIMYLKTDYFNGCFIQRRMVYSKRMIISRKTIYLCYKCHLYPNNSLNHYPGGRNNVYCILGRTRFIRLRKYDGLRHDMAPVQIMTNRLVYGRLGSDFGLCPIHVRGWFFSMCTFCRTYSFDWSVPYEGWNARYCVTKTYTTVSHDTCLQLALCSICYCNLASFFMYIFRGLFAVIQMAQCHWNNAEE